MPKKSSNKFDIPWVEKYRPIKTEDILVDQTNAKRINYFKENLCMPNIIIAGETGVGKTTTINCLAKIILKNKYKDCVLELNASDERGIKIVQESMTIFCKKKIDQNINHKIILLDEADNLTSKAQQLIATLMEKYSKTTRFAFTCNNSSEIIDSIQSRCTILKYKRLTSEQLEKKIIYICEKENIKWDKEGIDAIILDCKGDLRTAINNLQAVYTTFNDISLENVRKICDKPDPIIIKKIVEYCQKNDINKAVDIIYNLKKKGYSGSDIIQTMVSIIKKKSYVDMNEFLRIKYIENLGKTCMAINKGVDTNLQLYGCIARLCKCN